MVLLRNLAFILTGLFSLSTQAQKVDTLVSNPYYKSYYSYGYKVPLYVTYFLFKGGGTCSRTGMNFKSCGIKGPEDSDYAGSTYDKGHLANAEDFAADCEALKATFCYFNCAPQTTKLNRGIWKVWETKIRQMSQKKKLFVVAGNIFGNKKMGTGKVAVPSHCYKIVIDPATKKTLLCLLFENDADPVVTSISVSALKKILAYPLVP